MKNNFCIIEKLSKENDKTKFWKKFNFLKNSNNSNINVDINELENHYESLFSGSFDINPINKELVLNGIKDLDNKLLYSAIDLDFIKFNNAFKKTKNSHVSGFDKVSSYMLNNTSDLFKYNYIFPFFKFIFKNCVIPDYFNTSFIRPILKDNKKSNSDLKNLRPFSISNTLSQIFERLILEIIPELMITHDNQFGYKNKTGCLHAIFCIKETIINHINNKKPCYIVSFDAEKAFD